MRIVFFMNFFRTSFLNAAAVAFRMFIELGLNKLLATIIGPAGFALLGQFQNVMAMLTLLATGGINTGIVTQTAIHRDDVEQRTALWRTAWRLMLGMSSLTGALLWLFAPQVAQYVLQDVHYAWLFRVLAVSLVFIALQTLLLSVLNGLQEIPRYVAGNTLTSLTLGITVGSLTWFYGLPGALLGFGIYLALAGGIVWLLSIRRPWCHWNAFWGVWNPLLARQLGHFALMGLTSAVASPVALLFIRDHLVAQFGLTTTGLWQTVWKISGMYLMFFMPIFHVYFLPRLAALHERTALRQEIKRAWLIMVPIFAAGCGAIWLLRDWVIGLLLTPAFSGIRDLLAYQLVGDVIRCISLLLGFLAVAKSLSRIYIVAEITASTSFVALTYLLTPTWGIKGVLLAHGFTYTLYGLLLAWQLWRHRVL